MQMRDELGSLYEDDEFAALYSAEGQPGVRPWRLALVTVMQFAENLSDRQAAEAVRGRIDWKYALSLPLEDAGFDFSVLSEFRQRLLAAEGGAVLLDGLLARLKAKGLVKGHGTQRTDATHVLAAVRDLNRLENVGETLRQALNELATVAAEWLQAKVPPEWYDRYSTRFERYRLPKRPAEQRSLTEGIGQDGYDLLTWLDGDPAAAAWRDLPSVSLLRRVWEQQYRVEAGRVHQRTVAEMPPPGEWICSPFDDQARYGAKGEIAWVGYKVHVTESCEPDLPHLITQVTTTDAARPDQTALPTIQQDLLARDLAPALHLVDSGYLEARHLVTSQAAGIDLLGPARLDASWQARLPDGLDQATFAIDWSSQTVTCPAGHRSQSWRPSHASPQHAVIRVAFATAVCQPCPLRARCVRGQAGRHLTLLPQPQHTALLAARLRQQSDSFWLTYRARAGIEGTFTQANRRAGLRRSRYVGLAKTHLQHLAIAAALNLVRLFDWWRDIPFAPTRRSSFARLRPLAA
jgi:transposase